jgi:hypothetical protein
MTRRIKTITNNIRCVVLVDVKLTTSIIGKIFSEQVRSSVCQWVDSGICDVILFSTLDASFITREGAVTGRAVTAVTTLPPLDHLDLMTLFQRNINVNFVDVAGCAMDREIVFNQLASISGGHPCSLEYIIDECNKSHNTILVIDFMQVT